MKTNRDKDINGYSLSRQWFDFSFQNPEKIRPNHTALYFYIIEHCNRLGWKDKFGLPTAVTMEAIGIKSYNTYKKTLEELISFGFVEMIEKSKNQYSANIIALSNFDKALDKALDEAIMKNDVCPIKKQQSTCESTCQSTVSINKQLNNITYLGENALEKSEKEKEFDRFNSWIDDEAGYIRRIKDQITFKQYCKITEKYNGTQIKQILGDIANYKDAPKKYTSVYMTFLKWSKKEFGA